MTSQVDDFIDSIEKFVATLGAARSNMNRRFVLPEVDIGFDLSSLKGPNDYSSVSSYDVISIFINDVIGSNKQPGACRED